jgi:diazepam-binding inhibitor (GABA receptor modulator, acyl-CoA-binding protein)
MSAADFNAAVAYVRTMPKGGPVHMDNKTKLEFYSLFKQATEGNVKGTRPWAVNVEARAKWDAWNARKGMSSEAAKAAYVKRLVAVLRSKGIAWPPAAKPQSKL